VLKTQAVGSDEQVAVSDERTWFEARLSSCVPAEA